MGKGANLRAKIFEVLYQSPLGGHYSQMGTYMRINGVFYSTNMKAEVIKWASKCDTCQRVKGENVLSPGLLQLLPIPKMPW